MTAPVIVVELGERSAWFAGDAGLIRAAIQTVGCPKMFDRRRRAISVPRSSYHDVSAALELRFGADLQPVPETE